MADWRHDAGARATCQPGASPTHVITCSSPPVAIGGRQLAHDITYDFIGGRLARIRFLTSIDASDWVRARLDQRFGAPRNIVRDSIKIDKTVATPHVKAYWGNGRSTILLNDPEYDGSSLSVTYRLDAFARDLPASPA
jgi:hypothetical protein